MNDIPKRVLPVAEADAERGTAWIETMTVAIVAVVLLAVALTSRTDLAAHRAARPGDNFLKAGQAGVDSGRSAPAGAECLRGGLAGAVPSLSGCAGTPCPDAAVGEVPDQAAKAWKGSRQKNVCVGDAALCAIGDAGIDRCGPWATGRWV